MFKHPKKLSVMFYMFHLPKICNRYKGLIVKVSYLIKCY